MQFGYVQIWCTLRGPVLRSALPKRLALKRAEFDGGRTSASRLTSSRVDVGVKLMPAAAARISLISLATREDILPLTFNEYVAKGHNHYKKDS